MADTDSVSDTQVLLQSMLQRLRLQPRPESNSTHTQDEVQFGTTLNEQNSGSAKSPPQTPPMYNFDFSLDSKSIVTNQAGSLSLCSTGVVTSLSNSWMSSTPKQKKLSQEFMSNSTVPGSISTHADDDIMPKQTKQPNISDGSVASPQSAKRLLRSTRTSGQVELNIQDQGAGQKRWTQKVKKKWKDRNKITTRREQENKEKEKQNKVSNVSFYCCFNILKYCSNFLKHSINFISVY